MTEYIIMYLLFGVIILLRKSNLQYFKSNKLVVFLCFLMITILIGLRNSNMGNDLPGYIRLFHLSHTYSFSDLIMYRGSSFIDVEIGYLLFNKIVSIFTNNENIFLLIVAAFSILPIAFVVEKKEIDGVFAALIFIALPSFAMQFSGLRQVMAMSLCFLSVLAIQKKKFWIFIVIVLLAATFHKSALLFLVCYPVYWIKTSRNKRFGLLAFLLIIFVLRRYLFSILAVFLDENYQGTMETGAIGVFIFSIMNYLVTVLFSKHDDPEINGYLNILYIGMVVSCFISISNIALRVAEYYIMILILLIPKMISKINIQGNVIVIKNAYIALAIIMGLMYLYLGGSSWPRSYPYYWFWEYMQYTKWY